MSQQVVRQARQLCYFGVYRPLRVEHVREFADRRYFPERCFLDVSPRGRDEAQLDHLGPVALLVRQPRGLEVEEHVSRYLRHDEDEFTAIYESRYVVLNVLSAIVRGVFETP